MRENKSFFRFQTLLHSLYLTFKYLFAFIIKATKQQFRNLSWQRIYFNIFVMFCFLFSKELNFVDEIKLQFECGVKVFKINYGNDSLLPKRSFCCFNLSIFNKYNSSNIFPTINFQKFVYQQVSYNCVKP